MDENDVESALRFGMSRRAVLRLATTLAGTATAASVFGISAATRNISAHRPAVTPPTRTGTMNDLKHVVILMQENRSFDHYFGSLQGVRGFADKQALQLPTGKSVFHQPTPSRTDGGALLPFRMDTSKFDSQNAGGLPHDWSSGHSAAADGAWDRWVPAKGAQTMGYFTRDDLPYHYALADAFTVCDNYHCALNGPTSPNRLYFWTGTSDDRTDNPSDYVAIESYKTYPERLQDAGVSWQVYNNNEVGDGSGADSWVGDYGDNPLWFFNAYHDSMNSADPAEQQLAQRGGVRPWQPNANTPLGPNHVHHVLAEFEAACKAGTLPRVSWVVAPYGYCEHPSASPDYGAHYIDAILQAMMANTDVWESSALFVTYDENDGYFDHVLPPTPEAGTPDEFVSGLPIGFGARVPMLVASPWTRGGFVDSNVYDHTSMLQFLETWTGVKETNISNWRRQVSGDLTKAFDFANPDFTVPQLPDTVPLIVASDAGRSKPAVSAPAVGQQSMPTQESGTRPHRPTGYQPHCDIIVDRVKGLVTATMSNAGDDALSMTVLPDAYLPFQATPFLVAKDSERKYQWDVTKTDGKYRFSIYGPDGFVRAFAGEVIRAGRKNVAAPAVTATLVSGTKPLLRLSLRNDGHTAVRFILSPNDFSGAAQEIWLTGGASRTVDWPTARGYYDVTVTAPSGTGFSARYAGHINYDVHG
ncbi:phospholipase C [Nakamurella panacisegetis]|uniref:phospholipase C n=1 Tax=Nakamurella panacisegetis TaxID=1090615 RepID=A0A1H0S2P0_9ACTN|nr:phospholipase C, phosphocholine-specific [Nakamurella panacisegetis]SDP36012.1 phospholipase C [Nakamurella panacisegetis]